MGSGGSPEMSASVNLASTPPPPQQASHSALNRGWGGGQGRPRPTQAASLPPSVPPSLWGQGTQGAQVGLADRPAHPHSLQQGKSSSTGNLLDKEDLALPPPDYGTSSRAFPTQTAGTFKQRPYSVAVPAFSQVSAGPRRRLKVGGFRVPPPEGLVLWGVWTWPPHCCGGLRGHSPASYLVSGLQRSTEAPLPALLSAWGSLWMPSLGRRSPFPETQEAPAVMGLSADGWLPCLCLRRDQNLLVSMCLGS